MNRTPQDSLDQGQWFKLICGASYQHLPAIRSLVIAYSLAGADCIDVSADLAVIKLAQESIEQAQKLYSQAKSKGYHPQKPYLMVSLNDGEDPHFRKAYFNPQQCPLDCSRPCEKICPALAIQFTPHHQGIIDQRCYGCGRCLPICPQNLISTQSHLATPDILLPLIQAHEIQALEIHTQVGNFEAFKRLWSILRPLTHHLKIIAISTQDHPHLLHYLQTLYDFISPLPCSLIWQTDGRPMSGDIGKGTTQATIKLAQKVLASPLQGYIQLAGGTNFHTVTALKPLNLLQPSSRRTLSGIAYGSYARTLLNSVLNMLEVDRNSGETNNSCLENHSDLLWEAVALADSLVKQIKS